MLTRPPSTAFLGAPVVSDLERLDADVAILGIPHGSPYPDPGLTAGCAEAPDALRGRSVRLARFRGHWDADTDAPFLPPQGPPRLVDAGDVPGTPGDAAANVAAAEAAVRAIVGRGVVPVVLGGDDSTPIPFLRAWADAGPITVLQVDAHLDFRDEVDGVTDGYSSAMRRASEMSHVTRVLQVGLRGVGSARPEDADAARRAGHVLVPATEVRARGVGAAVLDRLGADDRIVLVLDADGLDPSVCPAVSGLAPGGLTYDEAASIVRGVGSRLAGAIFTELVPVRDVNGIGTLAILRLACAAAGAATR